MEQNCDEQLVQTRNIHEILVEICVGKVGLTNVLVKELHENLLHTLDRMYLTIILFVQYFYKIQRWWWVGGMC